jgi:hypothetical protein
MGWVLGVVRGVQLGPWAAWFGGRWPMNQGKYTTEAGHLLPPQASSSERSPVSNWINFTYSVSHAQPKGASLISAPFGPA